MELIQTIVANGTSSAINFSNIPNTYTDLVLVCSTRTTLNVYRDDMAVRFNGDTNNNYVARLIRVLEGGLQAVGGNAASLLGYFSLPGAQATANNFGNATIYISNYTSSVSKAVSVSSAMANDGFADAGFIAGRWAGTAAINSISVFSGNGSTIVSGSKVSLYGVLKGSGGGASIS